MLGVIGIHVGSYALNNPHANAQLVGILEILSRFTVPAFFFLSAFGLFLHTSVDDDFSYFTFLKKRMRVVLYPYLAWSLFYLLYNGFLAHDMTGLLPRYFLPTILFGNASYHLYFMVILLWFYLLMPLWRALVRIALARPAVVLVTLFLLQTAFNYWSSYEASSVRFDSPVLQYLYTMRLNYWVLHYVWIFLLGAVVAERYDDARELLWNYRLAVTVAFALAVTAMTGSYFYLLYERGYTLLEAIYTVHQLSPQGMLYTGSACLFFLLFFITSPLGKDARTFWLELGDASYGIYLIHPFFLSIFSMFIERTGHLYTAAVVVLLYVSAVCAAYLATVALQRLPKRLRSYLLGR